MSQTNFDRLYEFVYYWQHNTAPSEEKVFALLRKSEIFFKGDLNYLFMSKLSEFVVRHNYYRVFLYITEKQDFKIFHDSLVDYIISYDRDLFLKQLINKIQEDKIIRFFGNASSIGSLKCMRAILDQNPNLDFDYGYEWILEKTINSKCDKKIDALKIICEHYYFKYNDKWAKIKPNHQLFILSNLPPLDTGIRILDGL